MLNLGGIYDRMNACRFIHQNDAFTQIQTRIAAEFRTSPATENYNDFKVLVSLWAESF
jgi:hypothetical protein